MHYVAPLAGAWIEITDLEMVISFVTSLPSRERGLKSAAINITTAASKVAPLAGARIEINEI